MTPEIIVLAACHWVKILRSIRLLAKISACHWLQLIEKSDDFEVDDKVLNDTSNNVQLGLTVDKKQTKATTTLPVTFGE